MRSKTGLNLTRHYSINFSVPKRHKELIKFIIIHYTGMKKSSEAINRLCDPKSKVSSHFYIDKKGKIFNLVPELYEAWHAGKSSWGKFKSLNKFSIGVEIDNPGHENGYRKFSSLQISSTIKLIRYLKKKYNIKLNFILGHSDIASSRKKDPGEKFPWKLIAKKKLCIWHSLDENEIKKYRNSKLSFHEKELFKKNLTKIGYSKKDIKLKKNLIFLVKAFQMRFRQSLINGKIDKECLLISNNLI